MLKRETSLYLDIVRIAAAVTVLLDHLSGARFMGGFLWQFGPYGSEAVSVFFVLSGLVITTTTEGRDCSASAYTIARIARMYSVALPALLVTAILDMAGQSVRPDLYNAGWGFDGHGQVWHFLGGLLFLNQIWFLNIPVGSNLPYWSIGYEVWYYTIFGIACFAPRRWRAPGIALIAVLIGPKILAMLPLWLLGFAVCRAIRCRLLGSRGGAVLCLGAALLWAAYEYWAWRHGRPMMVLASWLRPEILQDYLVGLLFAAHLLGFDAMAGRLSLLARFAKPIGWIAGATFTLYLLHMPIAQFLITILPWPPGSWAGRLALLSGTIGGVLLLAELTERRKAWWRRIVSVALSPLGSVWIASPLGSGRIARQRTRATGVANAG